MAKTTKKNTVKSNMSLEQQGTGVKVPAKKKRKPGGGRKTKHSSIIDNAAKVLAEKGYTDKELAIFFGITEQTINNWKLQFPLFFESLKTGKKMSDEGVEASLYQRAIGYSAPDIHVSSYEGSITVTPIIKHYPPDTTAQIFWLKNRKPKEWRDRHDFEHSGEVKVTIVDYKDADKK